MFHSKQSLKSDFICDGSGDFTGTNRKTDEPVETIKIESYDSVKSIALVNEIPPNRRNVRRSLESKFNLSRISGTKKEIKFDGMDFNQFVFGESRLINRNKIDQKEKETRIHLIQRISKLNSKFGFEVAKELYRDTLNGIEKKESKWGNITEIQRIEMDIKFDNIKFETESDTDWKAKKVF